MLKKEYMIHIWGGAWNKDAIPSIEKDLGIQEGCYYFSTKQERDLFISKISQPAYKEQGMMIKEKYGIMSHKRTIFVATFKYLEKEWEIHYDFGYEYPEDSAKHYFTEGNFSCDCNRSLAIQREYGENAIDELPCGNKIKLMNYHIEHWD